MKKDKQEKQNGKETVFYLAIIAIVILVLGVRIFSQGRRMSDSIDRIQEEGMDIDYEEEEPGFFDIETQQNDEAGFDKSYISADGKLSFDYPSDWQKTDNDEILDLFRGLDGYQLPDDFEQEISEIDDLEDIDPEEFAFSEPGREDHQDLFSEMDIDFMAIKTTFPNLSIGIISVQEVHFDEEKTSETLAETLISDLEHEDRDTKVEISDVETGEYYVRMNTLTYTQNRPAFRSKNLALIGEDKKVYIINFNSDYSGWNEFENEFNRIISSIDFDGR